MLLIRLSTLFLAMPKSKKFYAVKKGRNRGIFHSWDECKAQTHQYTGAIFKSFKTMSEAQDFLSGNISTPGGPVISEREMVKSTQLPKASKVNSASVVRSLSVGLSTTDSLRTLNKNDNIQDNTDQAVLKIQMHFDGGSRGNPGVAGCGAHVVSCVPSDPDQPKVSKLIRHFCGENCTNNMAEYSGLVEGLRQIERIINSFCENNKFQSPKHVEIDIKGDSNLIINQMNGNYAVKNDGMRIKHQECKKIIGAMKDTLKANNIIPDITFEHVYRNENSIADGLANEAIDARKSWTTDEGEV